MSVSNQPSGDLGNLCSQVILQVKKSTQTLVNGQPLKLFFPLETRGFRIRDFIPKSVVMVQESLFGQTGLWKSYVVCTGQLATFVPAASAWLPLFFLAFLRIVTGKVGNKKCPQVVLMWPKRAVLALHF